MGGRLRAYETKESGYFQIQILTKQGRQVYSQEYGNVLDSYILKSLRGLPYKRIPLLRALLITGAILISGCGQICSKDPTLAGYLYDLQQIIYFNELNVCDMDYGDPGYKNAGVASITEFVRCDIVIKSDLTPYRMRAVVYHEVFHCLGVDHYYGPDYNIMSPAIAPEPYLKDNWPRLINEMRGLYDYSF